MTFKDIEKKRAWHKAWRDAHKEERAAYRKDYYKANKERENAQCRAYHAIHKDEMSERHRQYCEDHKEELKAASKVYSEKNKEKLKASRQMRKTKLRAYGKKWTKANVEKKRDYCRQRRIRIYKTRIEPINETVVYLRDGWICQHCKKRVNRKLRWPNPMSPSMDHIMPISQGGTHTYNNVQLAHRLCNLTKNVNLLPQGEQMRIF